MVHHKPVALSVPHAWANTTEDSARTQSEHSEIILLTAPDVPNVSSARNSILTQIIAIANKERTTLKQIHAL